MALDTKTVARIAQLARIEVPDSDLEPLAKELSNILTWIEKLNEVEIDGVEPMTSVVEMDLRRREDVVNDGDRAEDVLANAPEREGDFFVVPKVIE
jgi:aspartyl-tRNA(Asn)/glutamyl-tRNA(Gln) amidotransferase subunit C